MTCRRFAFITANKHRPGMTPLIAELRRREQPPRPHYQEIADLLHEADRRKADDLRRRIQFEMET